MKTTQVPNTSAGVDASNSAPMVPARAFPLSDWVHQIKLNNCQNHMVLLCGCIMWTHKADSWQEALIGGTLRLEWGNAHEGRSAVPF